MALIRNKWVIKALTDKAKAAMGAEMGGPWQMASDVYWQSIDDSRIVAVRSKLRAMGLTTEENDDEQFTF